MLYTGVAIDFVWGSSVEFEIPYDEAIFEMNSWKQFLREDQFLTNANAVQLCVCIACIHREHIISYNGIFE